MTIDIYKRDGSLLITEKISEGSFHEASLGQPARVVVEIDRDQPLTIPLLSYIVWRGERFTLWRSCDITKHSSRDYHYTIQFGSHANLLSSTKYKYIIDTPRMVKTRFPLSGKPRQFLDLLVRNLNERDGGWSLGTVIDAPEKTIAFNHESCAEVLARLADEWDTEWVIEDKRITLAKVERGKDDPIVLGYGKGRGLLPGIEQSSDGDSYPVGKLYVQGGERNIDRTTYGRDRRPDGSSTLLLPADIVYTYEGVRYRTDSLGESMSIDGVDLLGRGEDSYDGTHIYPRREGVVSRVISISRTSGNEQYYDYDIIDTSIPESLDFGRYRIDGQTVSIIFQSGRLAGQSFDIATGKDGELGYVHSERRFRLVRREDSGVIMPEPNTFYPSIGDRYAVFGISLPKEYIREDSSQSGAEWELVREMARYLHEHKDARLIHRAELDPIYARANWGMLGHRLTIGGYVRLSDPDIGMNDNVRITSIRTDLSQPYKPNITLSNSITAPRLSSSLGKMEAEEVQREESVREAKRYAERGYSSAIGAMEAIAKTFNDQFTQGISPVSVRTMQMVAGDPTLQFVFVRSMTSRDIVPHTVTWDADSGLITVGRGFIRHTTLGIADVRPGRPLEDYRTWSILDGSYSVRSDERLVYVYARCERIGQRAFPEFSTTILPFGSDPNHYYLLIGMTHDGTFTQLYGFTEILPGQITTGRILSADGNTYFDLERGEIGGNIRFSGGKDPRTFIQEIVEENSDTSLDYLKHVLQDGSTSVGGGLISTNLIAMREKFSVRAYIDGRRNASVAFAAGVQNFGSARETRAVTIRHNGSCDIGEMRVRAGDGRIAYEDASGVYLSVGGDVDGLREITENKVQSLEYTISSMNISEGGNELKRIYVLTEEFDITKNDFVMRVDLSAKIEYDTFSNNTSILSIVAEQTDSASAPIIPLWSKVYTRNEGSFQDAPTPIIGSAYLPKGRYRLALLVVRGDVYGTFKLSEFGGAATGDNQGMGRGRASIGGNGLVVYLSDQQILSLVKGESFRYIGKTDFPGWLASGTVRTDQITHRSAGTIYYAVERGSGAYVNAIGGDRPLCSNQGADGYYLVRHSVGHENYQVFITPIGDDSSPGGITATIYHRGANGFWVYLRKPRMEGLQIKFDMVACPFDYLITGTNKKMN